MIESEIEIVEPPAVRSGGEPDPSETSDPAPEPEYPPESAAMAEDPPGTGTAEGRASWEGMGRHLEELRFRLAASLAVFAPFFGLGLWLYRELWALVMLPLERAAPGLARFQALDPSAGLVLTLRLAFAFALFLSLPVWLSQLWLFVAPGLTGRERRWLYLSLGAGGVLFVLGAILAYLAGVPLALAWLLPFNRSLEGWDNAFTGEGYVGFVMNCCLGFGLAFELPLLMLALGWFGILTPENLRAGWRGAILGIFVLAAVLTPPDPVTQLLLALPLLLLFGIGYRLAVWGAARGEREG
ncbi:MAG: twin-arginine translocase subunit TatC [Planctomycetota bacterium]|jgi:sec-independent protein translocase protein TatC|nr:twin-arginine translocase subunit TatC [Planctomycetota bacterium]